MSVGSKGLPDTSGPKVGNMGSLLLDSNPIRGCRAAGGFGVDLRNVAAWDRAGLAGLEREILVGAVADQQVDGAAGVVLNEHGRTNLAAECGGRGGGAE